MRRTEFTDGEMAELRQKAREEGGYHLDVLVFVKSIRGKLINTLSEKQRDWLDKIIASVR